MQFFKKRIAAELLLLVENGYNMEQLVKWADSIYLKYLQDLDPDTRDLIEEYMAIDCGEEFYIPVNETMDNIVEILQQEKTTIQRLVQQIIAILIFIRNKKDDNIQQ